MDIVDKLTKTINEDIIFAGGTGQYITIIKNKINDKNDTFGFSDIDLQVKLNPESDVSQIKYQLISIFKEVINNSKRNKLFDLEY